MQGNGIGPLVSQFVHERNALRKAAAEASPEGVKPHPRADSAEFSESALARFEAWKAKQKVATPEEEPVTAPEVEPNPIVTPTEPIDEPVAGDTNSLTGTTTFSPVQSAQSISLFA